MVRAGSDGRARAGVCAGECRDRGEDDEARAGHRGHDTRSPGGLPIGTAFRRNARRRSTKLFRLDVSLIDPRGELLGRVQLARVSLHVRCNHGLILPDQRLERPPVEPFVGNLAHVAEVFHSQRRNRQQLRSQRLARIVESDQRIELGARLTEGRRELKSWRQLNAGW